ncbi:MAG: hypothetical protein ABI539_11840 [Acidobacteriota bacterium]
MIFEVVHGEVKISERDRFKELHRSILLPICASLGINLELTLMSEVGRFGRFINVYSYDSYQDYEDRSGRLESELANASFYEQIQACLVGTIDIELMSGIKPASGEVK